MALIRLCHKSVVSQALLDKATKGTTLLIQALLTLKSLSPFENGDVLLPRREGLDILRG